MVRKHKDTDRIDVIFHCNGMSSKVNRIVGDYGTVLDVGMMIDLRWPTNIISKGLRAWNLVDVNGFWYWKRNIDGAMGSRYVAGPNDGFYACDRYVLLRFLRDGLLVEIIYDEDKVLECLLTE